MRTIRSFGVAIIPKAFKRMPLSRHSARSFTFEIKRASRRRPEVVAVSKSISPVSSLAEEVFGTPSRPPVTNKPAGGAIPSGTCHEEVGRDNACLLPGEYCPIFSLSKSTLWPSACSGLCTRGLPAVSNHGQCASRFRRRNQLLRIRPVTGNTTLVSSGAIPQEHQTASPAASTVRPPRPLKQWDERDLRRKAMQAERKGRPAPRLPAGQRWKRRLPPACW